jgi:Flp pilus assembly protein TadG
MTIMRDPHTNTKKRHLVRRRRGAMVVLVLILLVALLASAALSVDVAYMHLSRTQLRASTDAAARAGAEAVNRTGDADLARQAARTVAASNLVAGQPLTLKDSDILVGNTAKNDQGTWVFTPDAEPLNSARVTGDRSTKSTNGEVSLFFGKFLGTGYFEPMMTSTVAKAPPKKRDFCLVVDRSHSMAFDLSGRNWSYPPGPSGYCHAPHPTLSRWAALVRAVNGFLAALKDTEDEERVGLVSYASTGQWCDGNYKASTVDCAITDNYDSISGFLAQRSTQPIPGATDIYHGILDGVLQLTNHGEVREDSKRLMVVMTDGRHNRGPDPVIAARHAANKNIQIITITFSDGADQRWMEKVAAEGNGAHYHAPTEEDLRRIFEQVAVGLDNLVFID